MVLKIQVEGYEAVKKAITENLNTDALFVLFSGSKDDKGQSWCPDCVAGKCLHTPFLRYLYLSRYLIRKVEC